MAGPLTAPSTANGRSTLRPRDLRRVFGRTTPADAAALLRFAATKNPSSPAGRAARRAAEAVLLRYARMLRRRARRVGGSAGAELQTRASDAYFRAVIARRLPELLKAIRAPQPLPPYPAPGATDPMPQPCGDAVTPTMVAPGVPVGVAATPGVAAAVVAWTPRPDAELVIGYTITPYIGATPQTATTVGPTSSATILGLTVGTAYAFTVKAANAYGSSAESARSATVTPTALPVVTTGTPLSLVLPEFSADPALLIDPLAERMRGHVAEAGAVATTWRYEHLKELAIQAAREAMRFDGHIERLMAMALEKMSSAELLLNPTLIAAQNDLRAAIDTLATVGDTPEVDSLLDPLGKAAAQGLLLERFVAWLTEHGPVSFYVGLFEAIINDLAAVLPPPFGSGNPDFGRTSTYLQHVFDNDIDGVRGAVVQMALDIRARLDADVNAMIAPLRAAVDKVIQGTSQAVADVFEAFDLPVLMTPPQLQGEADVPDEDPLKALYAQLQAQVDKLAGDIKQRIESHLDPIISGADDGLFKTIVITFLVLPILAFLVISLAGGPFSAALLAAVVLVAAEELLRLLLRWLAGPVLQQIDELKQRLTELVGRLQQFFAAQAALVENESPELLLEMLASELRELRDFMPETFLNETAQLLGDARDVVMRTATALGLAAEQALGRESATAFDAIPYDFDTHLPAAPQIPGGSDPSLFAGAALVAHLGRLDHQRTAVQDGKELELTHRLSLARLLGNATTFADFLSQREAVIHLTERDLLDRTFPGVYRALIKEVRVTGVFSAPVTTALRGIPVTVTHLGESRTRIKRRANPSAPPMQLPPCCPQDQLTFVNVVASEDVLVQQIQRAWKTVPLATKGEYFLVILLGLFLGQPNIEELLSQTWRRACLENMLDALDRLVRETSCGVVRPESFVAAARSLLESYAWAPIVLGSLLPATAAEVGDTPDLTTAAHTLAQQLRQDVTDTAVTPPRLVLPGLVRAAGQAWCDGVAEVRTHIAKWGDATLEEDPDPQVRSLGFSTLVRRMPQETVVFNLFADGPAANLRADAPTGSFDGPPMAPASTLQYRPLENRGLEGRLLVRLETLGDDSVAQLSDALSDLVLEIVIKGCYDADLAQTVRTSRTQTATGLRIVSNLSPIAVPIAQPDSALETAAGASARRTVHVSLRAHRDRTLQIWAAAAQAQPTLAATIAGLLAGKAMLNRDQPFQPLLPMTTFRIDLTSAAPPNTQAALEDLAGALHISPADLGVSDGLLAGLDVLEQACLESIGIAVVPMPQGVRAATDPLTADPLNLTLHVPPPLDVLLPTFDPAAPLPDRLHMTVAVTNPPTLASLFALATPPSLTLNLPAAVFSPVPLLYDVLVSFTYTVPVLETATHIAGLQ